ncbi:MAG TPA: HAD-IIA family hydrolase [bacterium]|nr:HAD-IIA family hydrolase [bacterium]
MKNIICDIDGVLLHQNQLIPGAEKFIERIRNQGNPFLLLTNNPSQTPADLMNRLETAGIEVPAESFYTSAMATAAFLQKQNGSKAYVIGEGALTHELYRIGFTITDINPDFLIVGDTHAFNTDMIYKASQFILKGAKFIATNPDVKGPRGEPACGTFCAPIERMTEKKPFYVGKPNAWMMRAALNTLGGHSENTVIIGDNMSTDILAGTQAGIETILVLTGVSSRSDLDKYPYLPDHIYDNVNDVDIL